MLASIRPIHGNLFEPPSGQRQIDGGWRNEEPTPWLLAGAGAAVLLGWWLLRGRAERSDALERPRGRSR